MVDLLLNLIHGTQYMVLRTWYLVHGTWYMLPGTWYMVPGTLYLILVPVLSTFKGPHGLGSNRSGRPEDPFGILLCMLKTDVEK